MTSTAHCSPAFRSIDARLVLTLIVAVAACPAAAQAAEGEPRAAHANRLADAKSPYLLLHADNPVEWYPWGEEAFAKAKAEDKPIFLSVGYSTCYWCHVAERTLYSDPAIAELMNRWFVNVKVDREQHPDVDEIYMIARHLIDGTGGWPNNVFLTPDLEPFFAGSYFPPQDDRLGRPGFPRVLRLLHDAWINRRDEVLEVAGIVHARMKSVQDPASAGDIASIDPSVWLDESTETFMKRFDPRHGGQRSGTDPSKFPQSPMLLLMLESHGDDDAVLQAVTKTLDAMAYGGIYDHLGGGFHRYSTEPTWSVPHFEKMLYDNAQLLEVYAQAYRNTGKPLYRYVAEDVASYLMTRMMSPEGGFFTAQDAQVDGVEGASYRWRQDQIEAILGEHGAERFFAVYELVPVPEVPGGTGQRADGGGVLRVRLPVEKTLRRAGFEDPAAMLAALRPLRERLLAAREARPQPLRDEKINVDLNALAIAGLASSSAVLERTDHLDAARRAAQRIWRLAYDPESGRLMHQIYLGEASIEGYLSDYALLGLAFLELHEKTDEGIWRARARVLAHRLLERFLTPQGGLPMTADGANLLVPVHSMGDDVQPSGTSAAIELLLRLGESADGARYRALAERVVAYYGGRIAIAPAYWSSAVLALNALKTEIGETAAGTENGEPRLPQSDDHVKVSAQASDAAGEDVVVVTLSVDAGYHVNANPASLDYLIPTSVAFEEMTPLRIRYPEPVPFRPSFADSTIEVYEGEHQIVSRFADGTLRRDTPVTATVTVQACNEEVCLPPSRIPLTVTPSDVTP